MALSSYDRQYLDKIIKSTNRQNRENDYVQGNFMERSRDASPWFERIIALLLSMKDWYHVHIASNKKYFFLNTCIPKRF